jgi:histidine kinase/DNA gyrase B/HSP90-like ATPase
VRNAFQHAKARHLETELRFGAADLCIRVRDDGVGVDPQILAQGQRPGRWGMPAMPERSESFGGLLRVWSERNAGTEVELRIPAGVAYQQRLASTTSGLRGLFAGVLSALKQATPWSRRCDQASPDFANGSTVTRLPVAENTALANAGPIGATPGSPTPVGASVEGTMCTSTFGISFMRRTR